MSKQPTANTAPTSGYMPQLDGIRALAVASVMVTHFVAPKHQLGIHWGEMGVLAFFVLSGYLITAILLRCRQFQDDPGQSVWQTTRQFYIRRFLRIFPLFYATLALMSVLNITPVRETLLWHVSYLSNVYFAHLGRFSLSVSHLWSLAVEEQFYLVWPWVVLVIPRRMILPTIVGMVISGPVFRGGYLLAGGSDIAARVLMPGNLDTLGMGALLAYLIDPSGLAWERERVDRLTQRWMVIGLIGGVATSFWLEQLCPGIRRAFLAFFLALVFTWVIHRASVGFKGPMGSFLSYGPLVYVGKVSYGVYVLHNFMPHLTRMAGLNSLVWRVTTKLGLTEVFVNSAVFPMLWMVVSIVAAVVSWHAFEKPINSLKRRYPYRVQPARSDLSDTESALPT